MYSNLLGLLLNQLAEFACWIFIQLIVASRLDDLSVLTEDNHSVAHLDRTESVGDGDCG